jgi:hypothetical protein
MAKKKAHNTTYLVCWPNRTYSIATFPDDADETAIAAILDPVGDYSDSLLIPLTPGIYLDATGRSTSAKMPQFDPEEDLYHLFQRSRRIIVDFQKRIRANGRR